MIEELFPPPAAAAEAFDDTLGGEIFPAEAEAISRAVDKRRREFITVRLCARAALARIGVPPLPILPAPDRSPRWPPGVVGSMTHCEGYRGAAVARTGQFASIGLDAEPNEPLPDGVAPLVASAPERDQLAGLAGHDLSVCWDRLLFSAKESVYKAWFPLTRRWLGFNDVVISFQGAPGTFHARLLVPGPVVNGRGLAGFDGVWLARRGLLLTGVTVPARC
jgi:4'-phosphopantetheinyl transferase EntD